jgi:hypothetical protein
MAMSTKTAWEQRVGMLLSPAKHPTFVYSFKPVDSSMYGGQPRIDWHACDISGRYWMIEVKSLPANRRSINLVNDVTVGQREGLCGVAASTCGIALLAVGQDRALYIFDWREVWQRFERMPTTNRLLPLDAAFLTLTWTGPKGWTHSLYHLVAGTLPSLAPTPKRLAGPSQRAGLLP